MLRFRWSALVLLLLAFSAPAAASPAPPEKAATPRALPSAAPIFYEIRALAGEKALVEVEVRVNGALHLRERLVVPRPAEGGAPVIELLAYNPAERARLAVLAKSKDVRVIVSVDGARVNEASFEKLEAASTALRERELRLVATERPTVSGPGVLPVRRPAVPLFLKSQEECMQSCSDAYDACMSDCVWVKSDKYVSCDQCSSDYNNCVAGCQPYVPNCPTSSEHVWSEVVSYYWTWLGRCMRDHERWWETQLTQYDEAEIWKKHTHYRVTHNCDGSNTTEILSVWYTVDRCYTRKGWDCYDPTSPPFPSCTF
ncbi:MAG TPA: hypothetical protein VLQ45_31535 [Thermoanaerobaculia bacterium]|nr:hypothetical protein [Thermoanaerobaculia bacterium]